MVSVAALMAMGMRSLDGGGRSSRALSLASALIEELEALGFHQTAPLLGEPGCDPRSTAICRIDSRSSTGLTDWQRELATALPDAHAEIELTALDGADLAKSVAMRVRVVVHWRERRRRRSVVLLAVRM